MIKSIKELKKENIKTFKKYKDAHSYYLHLLKNPDEAPIFDVFIHLKYCIKDYIAWCRDINPGDISDEFFLSLEPDTIDIMNWDMSTR